MAELFNKKITAYSAFAIIIVLAIVLVGGIIVWQYQFPSGEEFYQEGELKKGFFSDDCEKLASQLENLVEKMNYCEERTDCLIIQHSVCALGPFILINKDADMDKLGEGMGKYLMNCGTCDWAPLTTENMEKVDCVNNVCKLTF